MIENSCVHNGANSEFDANIDQIRVSNNNALKSVETIAVTVYSIVSSTVYVDIDSNKTYEDKCKIINDIASDVYDVDSDIGDVYEKIHNVCFAEIDSDEDDEDDCCSNSEYKAILNSAGNYVLVKY
jgi:enamine deaminase RidA (YjgF/YER057c/UK114 family)